jgi:putative ABC transport system substrate-binding protein
MRVAVACGPPLTAGVRLQQSRSDPSLWLSRGTTSEKEMTVRLQTVGRVATLALALLMAPLAAAQQAGKVSRIGILGETASDPSEARLWQAFRFALRERGWREGENLRIESRWAEGNAARLPELAAELVRLQVDLIVTRGSTYVQGAQQATSSIPIVFTMHADPLRTGYVASLARPGGHITGLSAQQTDLYGKGLEFLRAAVPEATRIAVLWNPETPSHTPALTALEEAARTLQVQLQPVVARTAAEFEDAFAAMARTRAGRGGALLRALHRRETAPGRVSPAVPAANGVRGEGERGSWRPDELRPEFRGSHAARRHLCGQDPQGRAARGPARRAVHAV